VNVDDEIDKNQSENFTPAAKSYAEDFNISWNESFHGHGGPIESSYPVFQFPSISKAKLRCFVRNQTKHDINPVEKFFQAWHSLNITTPKDPGGGHKEGVFWAPSSLDPRDQTRSYARRSHYDRTQPSRPNYHLLPDNAVSKIIFKGKTAIGAEYISTKTKTTAMVYARKEVVLAAGSMHTPQILQLSGVGPSTLLRALKIDIIADLPGVGQNFQDNPTIYANFTCGSTFH
jgi:choline dehydrogenase